MCEIRNITVFDNLGSLGEMESKNDMQSRQTGTGSVATTNLSWDRSASQQGLQQAAQTVVAAVRDSTKQITGATAASANRVVDAVKKISNETESSPGIEPHPLAGIYDDVSDSFRRVSTFIDFNPEIDSQKVEGINHQLGAMIEGIGIIGEAKHRLDYAQQSLDWELNEGGDSSFPVANAAVGMRIFDSFQDAYASGGK